MNEWLMIFGMALVTFSVRYPVLAIVGKMTLPPAMLRALKYVPAVVLTAIIVPEVFIRENRLDLAPSNAHLIGAIVATLIAWRSNNLLWTIVGGMGTFLLWRTLF